MTARSRSALLETAVGTGAVTPHAERGMSLGYEGGSHQCLEPRKMLKSFAQENSRPHAVAVAVVAQAHARSVARGQHQGDLLLGPTGTEHVLHLNWSGESTASLEQRASGDHLFAARKMAVCSCLVGALTAGVAVPSMDVEATQASACAFRASAALARTS